MTATPSQMVCQVLNSALSSDREIRNNAESQLEEWGKEPGFYPTITQLCLNQEMEMNIRWIAVLFMKNSVNKFWRRGARYELPIEDKQKIRQILLESFEKEQTSQIALQIAVLIGRIARIDCPRDWPELLPELLKRLEACVQNEAGPISEKKRILLVLYHVIKELASRRLIAERRLFEELASNIFGFQKQLWDGYTTLFYRQLESDPTAAMGSLDCALHSLKILRKLTIYGFTKPSKSECFMQFIQEIFVSLKQGIECRYQLRELGASEILISLLEKFILKQMKTIYEFQENHSAPFARFVPTALEFSFHYVFHEGTRLIFTGNVINFCNFAIHCVNIMKNIMLCSDYTTVQGTGTGTGTENLDSSNVTLSDFFTNERLIYICEKIITHYFLLTQNELDSWKDNPESFAPDGDAGEMWKYALRPSVETLFVTCFTHNSTQMIAEVVKYIQRAQQIHLTPEAELKDILLKDAIYSAVSLTAYHFFHEIDFDAWFAGQLLAELRIPSDNFRILRRRIICLVGAYTNVKFSREMRPLAYEACLFLLRPEEDMSTRLAASKTLSILISDYEFLPPHYLPYLERSFNALFMLLQEAHECETKMKVLTIMSTVVETMSDYIEPYTHKLIEYLPLLWKESADYDLLRCAIISTLHQIVKAMRDIPEPMKAFLYNVIQLSTDITQPCHVYLMEEGLALWLVVVENSTVLTPQLLDLCKNLLPILEVSSENMRTILLLFQAYILLDSGNYFLTQYGPQWIAFCTRMFDDLRSEGICLILKVYEVCLKADPHYSLELLRPSLTFIFKQVYLDKEFPMLMGMYLTILARVLLINQEIFTAVVQELQLHNALETILDVWINKMPVVSSVEKRKLFCLAFCSVFSNNSLVLERFPAIMQNISETFLEIMEAPTAGDKKANGDVKKKLIDTLVFQDEQDLDTSSYCSMDDFDYKTYHYDRCRLLSLKDPVHKINLPEYLEWQLNSLRTVMGNEAYQQLLQSVHPPVLQKIGDYLKLS